MMPPRVRSQLSPDVVGYWRILVYPKVRGKPHAVDISMVRGIPTKLGGFSFSDPFGPKTASISFPGITYFDRKGEGELWWLRPYADVEIEWVGLIPGSYGYGTVVWQFDGTVALPHRPRRRSLVPAFTWSGRIEPFSYDKSGLTLALKGSLYVGDDYLGKPEFVHSPLPYEWSIAKKFLGHPHLGLKPLKVDWPAWWTQKYGPPPRGTPSYLIPQGVSRGQFWSALLTRQTGSWDPVLTSYIQALLASMYTERGRWTMDLMPRWQPLLTHRDMLHSPDASTVVVDVTDPNNELSFDEDWSQAISAVYGQGTSLAGNVYSGMQVSPNGMLTTYEPLAALRQVHPENERNEWLDLSRSRKEVLLQMQEGLTELQAKGVAEAHLRRFGDPGLTGQLVLRSDPTINGVRVPRMLVRAGMSFHAPNVLGRPEGILAHITENNVDAAEETNTLVFDTKYRDALTVSQVRLRGRDAMAVQRQLVVGVYQPPIPDQLIPWDYSTGSGYIPSGPTANSLPLFDGMPADVEFPWEPWTTQRPPSSARWRRCYIGIPPANANADYNWAFVGSAKAGRLAIPIRLAQAGTIRLVQIAAYDASGHVLPVGFHFSLYSFHGVGVSSMPKIPAGQHYGLHTAGQHYPFGIDAWEKYTAAGTLTDPNIPQPATSGGLIRGWGDRYERPGFWPGASGHADPATGLYVDEGTWTFDLTQVANQFNPYSTKQLGPYRGMGYLMVYCDEQGSQPVYFLGRMFRSEPGAQS